MPSFPLPTGAPTIEASVSLETFSVKVSTDSESLNARLLLDSVTDLLFAGFSRYYDNLSRVDLRYVDMVQGRRSQGSFSFYFEGKVCFFGQAPGESDVNKYGSSALENAVHLGDGFVVEEVVMRQGSRASVLFGDHAQTMIVFVATAISTILGL